MPLPPLLVYADRLSVLTALNVCTFIMRHFGPLLGGTQVQSARNTFFKAIPRCSASQCRFVECLPDVGRVQLLPEDSTLIMASDGLWDVLSDQLAVDTAEVCVPIMDITTQA